MPFSCAKAVCATFCQHISGALIPIFGPQFPSECVHPDAPDHGRMCIDPALVAEATLEAEDFRRLYGQRASMASPISPRQQQQRRINNFQGRSHQPSNLSSPFQSRQYFRGGQLPDSPYGTDTEEYDSFSGSETELRGAKHQRFKQSHYPYTPAPTYRAIQTAPAPTSSGWTAANHERQHSSYQPSDRHLFHGVQFSGKDQQYDHASPFLSALPRLPEANPQSSPSQPRHYLLASQPRHCNIPASAQLQLAGPQFAASAAAPPTPVMSPKRPRAAFEAGDSTDHDYDGGESHVGSSPTTSRVGGEGGEGYKLLRHQHSRSDLQLPPIGVSMTASVAERNAALLLLNLSVTEGHESGGTEDKSEEQTEKQPGGPKPWASVLEKAAMGIERCQPDGPAKKKRRTISI